MLRYKTETRPGLVALYDIRPGNGVGPFLQPRSPHGAADDGDNWNYCLFYRLLALHVTHATVSIYWLVGWGLTALSAQIGHIVR